MAKSLENLFGAFALCVFLCLLLSGVEGSNGNEGARPLFAFGDSYADTGNINKSMGGPWYEPYGITVPGAPTGRFSDGHVLTDFIAYEYLGAKQSPVPYTQRRQHPERSKKYGVNFAIGGTGTFDMPGHANLNLTTEVGFFQKMLSGEDEYVHIDTNLTNSVAFVSISGNDYKAFVQSNPNFTIAEVIDLIGKVVENMKMNLERLLGMGFRRILVSGLHPLGCVPFITANSSFKECNKIYNLAVGLHNIQLKFQVYNLNKDYQNPPIHILDLDKAFMSVIAPENASSPGRLKFTSPLTPCCFRTNPTSDCGKVDNDGNKLYTLCDDRSDAFFWDGVHPTHAAWEFMFPILIHTLTKPF